MATAKMHTTVIIVKGTAIDAAITIFMYIVVVEGSVAGATLVLWLVLVLVLIL